MTTLIQHKDDDPTKTPAQPVAPVFDPTKPAPPLRPLFKPTILRDAAQEDAAIEAFVDRMMGL